MGVPDKHLVDRTVTTYPNNKMTVGHVASTCHSLRPTICQKETALSTTVWGSFMCSEQGNSKRSLPAASPSTVWRPNCKPQLRHRQGRINTTNNTRLRTPVVSPRCYIWRRGVRPKWRKRFRTTVSSSRLLQGESVHFVLHLFLSHGHSSR